MNILQQYTKSSLPGVELVWGTWFSSFLGIVGYVPGLSSSSWYLFCLGDDVGGEEWLAVKFNNNVG